MKNYIILFTFLMILLGCKEDKVNQNFQNNTIFKIAGYDLPKINRFEFNNPHTFIKDSTFDNLIYIEFDSILGANKYKEKGEANSNYKFLYVEQFELGDTVPVNIDYYIKNKSKSPNVFTYLDEFNGIPYHLKFTTLGSKVVVYVPYQLRLEHIENTNDVIKTEIYSIYVDTVEVK